jgi:hypothetical protein
LSKVQIVTIVIKVPQISSSISNGPIVVNPIILTIVVLGKLKEDDGSLLHDTVDYEYGEDHHEHRAKGKAKLALVAPSVLT